MITFGSAAGDALTAGAAVIADPALPEVVRLIKQLNDAEKKKAAASGKPADFRAGVGLSAALAPLRAVVYVKQNTRAVPVLVAGIIGIPFLLGFIAGARVGGSR